MNPLTILALIAITGTGLAVVMQKQNAVGVWLGRYWAAVRAGGDPDSILAELVAEADPSAIVPPGYVQVRASYIVETGRPGRGLIRNRVIGEGTAQAHVAPHNGHDIQAAEGTPVRAAKSGVVSLIKPVCGYGNIIALSHLAQDQESTWYGHLQYIDVGLGQVVRGGDPIARVGRTNHCPNGQPPENWLPGRAEAMRSHLHFQVHAARIPAPTRNVLDPVAWLENQTIQAVGRLT